MELKKKDLQDFFKRLRKASEKIQSSVPIKYYACGEYGSKTKRPHYHIILFNAKVELIQTTWQKGEVHYGDVSGASIGYTLKYMSKPSKIPMHRNDDRQPEFSLMSKGLGENYLTNNMQNWHKKDLENRMYVNLTDGKKIAMPRYYKDKLYTEDERKIIAHYQKYKMEKEYIKEVLKDPDNNYRIQESADLAKFKKLHYNAERDRNKI